jgi:chromate transporter
LSAALAGITAAVVGVILNLAVWFSIHALFGHVEQHRVAFVTLDVPSWQTVNVAALLLTVAAVFAVFRLRWNMLAVLGASATLGIALRIGGIA